MTPENPSPPRWSSADIAQACQSPLHPDAVHGIELFNLGHYFEAHEALEQAWRAEPGAIRDLYRGILLAGVALLHIQRGNYSGACKVTERCLRWLADWPDLCCGAQIGKLKKEISLVLITLQQMDAQSINQFDFSIITPILYSSDWPQSPSSLVKGLPEE